MISRGLRKQLQLPITKSILYYPNRFENNTELVTDIEVVEEFDTWFLLCITTEYGKHIFIHSGYLKNMQSPTFIEDMAESDKGN